MNENNSNNQVSDETITLLLIFITAIIQIFISALFICSFGFICTIICAAIVLFGFYLQIVWINIIRKKDYNNDTRRQSKKKKTLLIEIIVVILVFFCSVGLSLYNLLSVDIGYNESSWRFTDEVCHECGKEADGGCYKMPYETIYYCGVHYREHYNATKNAVDYETCKDCDKRFVDYSGSGGYCKKCKEFFKGMQDAVDKYS